LKRFKFVILGGFFNLTFFTPLSNRVAKLKPFFCVQNLSVCYVILTINSERKN